MAAISPSARLAFLLALFYLGWGKFLATDTDVYLIDYAQRIVIIALSWGMLRDALRRPLPLLTNTAWLWALAGSVGAGPAGERAERSPAHLVRRAPRS